MEIRVLQYFLAIARMESISRAADYLHITQPTLSRQIKELEDELGKTLFIRGSRKITLTDEGMYFRKRAEEIINLIEKTETEMVGSNDVLSGEIYIGGGETEGMRLVAKAIKRVQEEQPLIKFHLVSGNAQDITDRLDKGIIDFGFLIEPTDLTPYDFIRLPTSNKWGILMRKDSPLAHKDFITADDLQDLPLICSSQDMITNTLAKWLGTSSKKLNIVAKYNLIYNASLLVEEGVGYAFTLDRLVSTHKNSPLCFKPLNPILTAGHSIVWKKYQVFSKSAEFFLEVLQEEIELANHYLE